jgi:DNA-binding transcriptional MerR regulator
MQIGIVAKKIGLSVDAIRFYERNALLPRAASTQGGFRQYGESDVGDAGFHTQRPGLGIQTHGDTRSLESARKPLAAMCAADWKKNWLMYSGNLRTFRSWNTSCAWLCGVAITQSCEKRMHANRRVPSES